MVLVKRGHILDENVINKIFNLEHMSGDKVDVYVLIEEIEPGIPEG